MPAAIWGSVRRSPSVYAIWSGIPRLRDCRCAAHVVFFLLLPAQFQERGIQKSNRTTSRRHPMPVLQSRGRMSPLCFRPWYRTEFLPHKITGPRYVGRRRQCRNDRDISKNSGPEASRLRGRKTAFVEKSLAKPPHKQRRCSPPYDIDETGAESMTLQMSGKSIERNAPAGVA